MSFVGHHYRSLGEIAEAENPDFYYTDGKLFTSSILHREDEMRGKSKRMRGKEKGNIAPLIMILLGVVLMAYVGFTAFSVDQTDLDAAVYLEKPVYDSANDDNLVIVPGKVKVIKPAVDPDLKVTLDAFGAFRHVHVLHDVSKSESAPRYQWDVVLEDDPDAELTSKWMAGEGAVGDFQLSEAIMKRMLKGDEYRNLKESEIPEGFHLVTDSNDTVWITNAPDEIVANSKALSSSACKDYVGCVRIRYGVWDQVEKPDVTLVGVQKAGGVLDPTDAVQTLCYEGSLDAHEIHLGHRVDGVGEKTWLVVSAVGLIVIGLFLKFTTR